MTHLSLKSLCLGERWEGYERMFEKDTRGPGVGIRSWEVCGTGSVPIINVRTCVKFLEWRWRDPPRCARISLILMA